VRRVDLETGRVLSRRSVPRPYFAEGLTIFQGRVVQLTWQSQKGFVYDLGLRLTREFAYTGEGWGLTHDGASLIMSDGTPRLRFLDPVTFAVRRVLDVTDAGRPVESLNELEFVRGEVYANVWPTDWIVRIDPVSGRVVGRVDLTGWLAAPETLWAPWRLSPETLAQGQRDAVLVALMLQEAAGIDIVTDGEQSRQHFVHGFLTRIDGIDFTKRVTIGIRADRYKAEVPTVTGPLRRREPVHLDEVRWARAHTDRRLKFTLPGPMTIVDTLADEYFRDRRALAMEFARVLNEEIRDLEKAGLDVVQLDEPAFNVYMADVAAWGIEALHRAVDGLSCTTAVHICYGYGIKANIDWKRTLGNEWRQY